MAEYRLIVDDPPRFGVLSGYAYTINAVIGAGFLSIPWAYQNAGWALALGMQAVFLIVGWLLSSQLHEITSRVTALKLSEVDNGTVSFAKVLKVSLGCETISPEKEQEVALLPKAGILEPKLVDNLQFDLYELVKFLMGDFWAGFYFMCNLIFLLGCMTAYINIFGTGIATYVPIFETCSYRLDLISPICEWQYSFCVGVFFVLMLYFSTIEFHEQTWMQVTMTIMRIFVISSIIIIMALSIIKEQNLNNSEEYRSGDPPLANFSTIGHTIPIILFAGIYQPYYPGILHSIKKDPLVLSRVLIYVTLTLLVLYSVLGITSAFSVQQLPSNASLLFADFTYGHALSDRPLWTYIIGYLIVLFPAIDVISIFPIVSHAVSDNFMSFLYGSDRSSLRKERKLAYYGLRMGCIIPAFVYAFNTIKLGPIVNNSGLICFFLAFFMIPLLHIAAKCLVTKKSEYEAKFNPLVSTRQWLSMLIAIGSIPLFFLNAATAIF